jgi:alpha(1,3/1,4) fucosyltransferase
MSAIKHIIKVKFTDFWNGFDLANFMLYTLLQKKYELIISDDPDVLFYSVYGSEHSRFTCTKVFFTAENVRPNFNECDFAFSFDWNDNYRNYRLPLYAFYGDVNEINNRVIDENITLRAKTKFCCFVVSNDVSDERNNFFKKLSKHKHIDSGGLLFNNVGGPVENKREFIKDYKFVIAFENASYPGYVTEKIFEPLLENCVPIYWGNPCIEKDFNTRRFINCHDFESFDDVIKHVLEVDRNDETYLRYLREPAFINNELNENIKEENIISRLEEIITFNHNRSWILKKCQKLRPLYCKTSTEIKRIQNRISSRVK